MDHGFDNVTVCGKLCYVFMCMERYLLALYPDRDWSFVARKMWNCVSFWYGKRDVEDDCWAWGRYMDIIPDNLFETRREWAHYSHELREEFYGEMTDDDYRSIRECFTFRSICGKNAKLPITILKSEMKPPRKRSKRSKIS